MNQIALLNFILFSYFSFLHFPISEHENPPQIKYITFDHPQHIRAVCPYIHVCRFYWGSYM